MIALPTFVLLSLVLAYALRALRKRINKYDASFVKLHVSQDSVVLPTRTSTGPGLSLAQVIRDSVPALGKEAKFDGLWWLPGYAPSPRVYMNVPVTLMVHSGAYAGSSGLDGLGGTSKPFIAPSETSARWIRLCMNGELR